MASQTLCCTGLGKPSRKIVSLFPRGSSSWQTHGMQQQQAHNHGGTDGLKRVGTDNEWEETSQSMKVGCKTGAKAAVDLTLPTLIGVTLAGIFQGPQSNGVEEQAGKKVRDRNLQATISSLQAVGQECGTSNKLLIHRSRTGSWQWRRKGLAFLSPQPRLISTLITNSQCSQKKTYNDLICSASPANFISLLKTD